LSINLVNPKALNTAICLVSANILADVVEIKENKHKNIHNVMIIVKIESNINDISDSFSSLEDKSLTSP